MALLCCSQGKRHTGTSPSHLPYNVTSITVYAVISNLTHLTVHMNGFVNWASCSATNSDTKTWFYEATDCVLQREPWQTSYSILDFIRYPVNILGVNVILRVNQLTQMDPVKRPVRLFTVHKVVETDPCESTTRYANE